MWQKFITGQKPIKDFDDYARNIKRIDLDELMKTRQLQYKRYLKLIGKCQERYFNRALNRRGSGSACSLCGVE